MVHPGAVCLTGFEVYEKLGKGILGAAEHLELRAVTAMLSSQKYQLFGTQTRLHNSKMPHSHSLLKATLQGAHYYGGRLQAHVQQLSHPTNCQHN